MSVQEQQPPAAGRFVGARVNRVEDPRLLTGHGVYIDDVRLPGMVHAAFVRSPMAHGRIRSIDVSQAVLVPGVIAVWTGAEINGDVAGPLWDYGTEDTPFPPVTPLAAHDVRFVGDPVAIVVAESRAIAEDACELVAVDLEPVPAVIGRENALTTDARTHAELDTNVGWDARSEPDPALNEAFAASAHVIERTFHQHRHLNVPMEPRGLVAHWEVGSEQLTVHVASQGPHMDRSFFSRVLNIPEQRIRCTMRDVGGGFGQKIFRGRDETAVVLASIRLGRPVKWIEDRQENLMAANHARDEQMTIRMGLDENGVIQAVYAEQLTDVGAYPYMPASMPTQLSLNVLPGPYRIAHYGWRGRGVFTNTSGIGAYRGPWMMETTAREMMMDHVARELGIDPAELRRRNLLHADDLPYTTATGRVYDRITPAETFEAALDAIDYHGFRERQRAALKDGRYLGIGISSYIEPTAAGRGTPMGIEAATIRIEPSGKVSILMGTGRTAIRWRRR